MAPGLLVSTFLASLIRGYDARAYVIPKNEEVHSAYLLNKLY